MDVQEETSRVRGWFEFTADPEEAGKTLVRLWEAKAWEELGHGSWREYCDAEFPVKPKWQREVRRSLVGTLSAAGMAQRDVSAALGVNQATISRDLQPEPDANASPQAEFKPDSDPPADADADAPDRLDTDRLRKLDKVNPELAARVRGGEIDVREGLRLHGVSVDHARRVSERIEGIVSYCAEAISAPALRGEMARVYQPTGSLGTGKITKSEIHAASLALAALASEWPDETPEVAKPTAHLVDIILFHGGQIGEEIHADKRYVVTFPDVVSAFAFMQRGPRDLRMELDPVNGPHEMIAMDVERFPTTKPTKTVMKSFVESWCTRFGGVGDAEAEARAEAEIRRLIESNA